MIHSTQLWTKLPIFCQKLHSVIEDFLRCNGFLRSAFAQFLLIFITSNLHLTPSKDQCLGLYLCQGVYSYKTISLQTKVCNVDLSQLGIKHGRNSNKKKKMCIIFYVAQVFQPIFIAWEALTKQKHFICRHVCSRKNRVTERRDKPEAWTQI